MLRGILVTYVHECWNVPAGKHTSIILSPSKHLSSIYTYQALLIHSTNSEESPNGPSEKETDKSPCLQEANILVEKHQQ